MTNLKRVINGIIKEATNATTTQNKKTESLETKTPSWSTNTTVATTAKCGVGSTTTKPRRKKYIEQLTTVAVKKQEEDISNNDNADDENFSFPPQKK